MIALTDRPRICLVDPYIPLLIPIPSHPILRATLLRGQMASASALPSGINEVGLVEDIVAVRVSALLCSCYKPTRNCYNVYLVLRR